MIEIYVDGSCRANGSKNSIGGYGAVVVQDGKIIDADQQNTIEETTNNRMELCAILWAISTYGREESTPIVYSDSAYCVNALTNWINKWRANGWTRAGGKKLENRDLIELYDHYLNTGRKIDLRHIRGHQGHEYNEIADGLATGKLTVEEVLRNVK